MAVFIDTHSHIYQENFDDDRVEVLDRAVEAGMSASLLPNVDLDTVDRVHALSDAHPEMMFPMMGIHPTSIDEKYINSLNKIEAFLGTRDYCAIGEIGIDLYWDKTYVKEQIEAFEEQMRWAMTLDMPIAIHTRDAHKEVFDCIHRVGDSRLRGVFHCFSGNADDLKEILGFQSFMLGIGGVVTFKNSGLDKVLKETPVLDKILLETDAPYLAPMPYRGKRNEPAYIPYIAEKLAAIYEIDPEEVFTQALTNTYNLFTTLPKP